MDHTNKYLVFKVNNQQFAIAITSVVTVILMVEVNLMKKLPQFIKGIINYHGEFIPVVDIRYIFGMPTKEIDLYDSLIIVKSSQRTFALWIDTTGEIIEKPDNEIIASDKFLWETKVINGLLKLEGEIVLIQNIDELLTQNEVEQLQKVLTEKVEKSATVLKKKRVGKAKK